MLKKIEQTKTRAEKIFEAKERNEQKLIERLRYKQDRDQEEEALRIKNMRLKEQGQKRKFDVTMAIAEVRQQEYDVAHKRKELQKKFKILVQ